MDPVSDIEMSVFFVVELRVLVGKRSETIRSVFGIVRSGLSASFFLSGEVNGAPLPSDPGEHLSDARMKAIAAFPSSF